MRFGAPEGDRVSSKITCPKPGYAIQRTRLFTLLDQSRRGRATLVSGPPGAGKTTLVATYVAVREIPCLWYQVDPTDQDPATLFAYLAQAATKLQNGDATPLPRFTPEFAFGLAAFARRYFRELYARLDPPFLLVFDNYQDVPEDSTLHEIVRDACLELPTGGHAILVSRRSSPRAVARLIANGKMTGIDWDELQLRDEEAREIAALHGRELSLAAAADLNKRVGAWAAGLRLMLNQKHQKHETLPDSPGPVVFDYFAEEVFRGFDATDRAILMRTALFPRMTAAMVDSLTGTSRAGTLLKHLAKQGYFTVEHGDRPSTYQFHPLFRQFLQNQVERSLSAEELLALREQAGMLLEASGQLEDAVALLQEAGAWDELAQIILKHAAQLLTQGRQRTLEEWLRALPREKLESDPWLLYWLGACLVLCDPVASRPLFERAYMVFKNREESAGLLLSWAGAVDSIFHFYGELADLDPWITELDKRMEADPTMPSQEIEARVAFSMFVALSFRQPNHPQIALWSEKVKRLAAATPSPNFRTLLLLHLATHWIWRGKLSDAKVQLNELNAFSETRFDDSPLTAVIFPLVEATYALHAGLHEVCKRAIERGLRASERAGIHIWDPVFLGHAVAICISSNDIAGSDNYLQRMGSAIDQRRYTEVSRYHGFLAWQALARHQERSALRHAETAVELMNKSGLPYFTACENLDAGLIFYLCGKPEQAEEFLTQARAIGKQIENEMVEWMYLLYAAALRFSLHDETALSLLRSGMNLGSRHGYVHFFFWPRDVIAFLCAKALEYGIEREYARRLITHHKLEPPTHARVSDFWPWPLKIYTLGRFSVVKDDQAVRFEVKTQQTPLKLLKAIIALGGRDVSEHRLVDLLWPEAEGDAGMQALSTTLFRLRKLIGSEMVKRQEGCLTLNPQLCWVDCWAFERLAGESAGANSLDRFHQLSRLYQRPFLSEEDDGRWAAPMQERLHVKMVDYIANLARSLRAAGRYDDVISVLRRGLEIDDLVEEFHRGLIHSFKTLGREGEAMAAYRRCQRILSSRLGVAPSAETQRAAFSVAQLSGRRKEEINFDNRVASSSSLRGAQ
jgi:LuxR family maltose regulon positive regulatory protein